MSIESIVIVRWSKGWVAHLRFNDPSRDTDLSSFSRYYLYRMIEAYVDKVVGAWK